MALTYQPFSETPQIQSLRRDLDLNLPREERLGSVLLGGLVLAATVSPQRIAKWGILTIGLALLWRGWSGRCPWYQRIGLDRRHGMKVDLAHFSR